MRAQTQEQGPPSALAELLKYILAMAVSGRKVKEKWKNHISSIFGGPQPGLPIAPAQDLPPSAAQTVVEHFLPHSVHLEISA